MSREGDFVQLPYSTRNPIEFSIPNLFYLDGGLLDIPSENRPLQSDNGPLATLYNIWLTDWIERSLEQGACVTGFAELSVLTVKLERSSFSFLRFVDVSPSEAHALHMQPLMQRRLTALQKEAELALHLPYSSYV